MSNALSTPGSSLPRRIWYCLGFGPHNRPYIPRTWAHLIAMIALAALVLADGGITALNLNSTAHPFVVETVLIPALAIERLGIVGLILLKIAQAAFLLAIFDYLRHRGYLLTPFALAFFGIVIYGLVDLWGLAVLLSPPTAGSLFASLFGGGLLLG